MRAVYDLIGAIGVRIVKSFAGMRMEKRDRLARVLAKAFWRSVPKRRHVTLTNLALCFPEKTPEERIALARRLYVNMARAAIDHGDLWAGSREQILSQVRIEGLEYITDTTLRPLIIIAPHFVGLDAAIIALSSFTRGAGIYQRQKNAAWDKAALQGRKRFNDSILIEKKGDGDIRRMIRLVRENLPFYYLPDMDYGRKHSEFIDFFGVKAATIPAASKLARITEAKVVFCVTEMTPEGYIIHVSKPWEDFPTEDAIADTVRIQKEIERWIRKIPDQYLWTHRRFKTRPEGEPSVY